MCQNEARAEEMPIPEIYEGDAIERAFDFSEIKSIQILLEFVSKMGNISKLYQVSNCFRRDWNHNLNLNVADG